VIAGGYDTQNLGDHAMLQVLMRDLRWRNVVPRVTVLSRHPDTDFDRHYGVTSIPNLDHGSQEAARGKVFRGLNGEQDSGDLQQLTQQIAEADALVIGGGRMLVDYTHGFQRGHLSYFVLLATLARCHGTKIILFAHSLETLSSESGAEHLRFLVQNADHVSLREQSSLEVLRAIDPSLIDERIEVLPDPALGLSLVSPYYGEKLPTLRDDLPVLAVNLRSYAWRDGSTANFEGRVVSWLNALRRERELQLLFVPQMTYDVDSGETDDRVIARRVMAALEHSEGVHSIESPLLVDEALGVYRHADAVLSMRRHGAVFAATQGVPVLPLSCEANTDYVSKSLGLDAWRVDVSANDHRPSVENTLALLDSASEVGKKLRARCFEFGQQAHGYADAIVRAIESKPTPKEVAV
jgi:polysaccharide pyruvyl transferase WcaK-like protein